MLSPAGGSAGVRARGGVLVTKRDVAVEFLLRVAPSAVPFEVEQFVDAVLAAQAEVPRLEASAPPPDALRAAVLSLVEHRVEIERTWNGIVGSFTNAVAALNQAASRLEHALVLLERERAKREAGA